MIISSVINIMWLIVSSIWPCSLENVRNNLVNYVARVCPSCIDGGAGLKQSSPWDSSRRWTAVSNDRCSPWTGPQRLPVCVSERENRFVQRGQTGPDNQQVAAGLLSFALSVSPASLAPPCSLTGAWLSSPGINAGWSARLRLHFKEKGSTWNSSQLVGKLICFIAS